LGLLFGSEKGDSNFECLQNLLQNKEDIFIFLRFFPQKTALMTMALKVPKTVLFLGILFVASIYRIVYETKLWKAETSAAAANGGGDAVDGVLTQRHPLAQRRLPRGSSAGSLANTSPLTPHTPRVQQQQQQPQQQRWNEPSQINLYLRPDEGDFLFSNSSTKAFASPSSSNVSSALPQWVHDYVTWHAQQLSQLTQSNWNQPPYRYLILRCLRYDILCAGTADRLSTLPALLRFGYDTQRIIFIHWQSPAALHEFLVPTSINWDIPAWLLQEMDLSNRTKNPLVSIRRDGTDGIINHSATVLSMVKILLAHHYDLQRQDINTEYSSYFVTRSIWKRKLVFVCVGVCCNSGWSRL
jgi:hypothetical protein